MFIDLFDRILIKELIIKFTCSLRIFENVLNIFSLLAFLNESLGNNEVTLFDDKDFVCEIAFFEEDVVA